MNSINFSTNWNAKLCADLISTVRKIDLKQAHFYSNKTGELYEIQLHKEKVTTGRLENVAFFKRLADIPLIVLQLDTGYLDPYPLFEKFGLTKESPCQLLLFNTEHNGVESLEAIARKEEKK